MARDVRGKLHTWQNDVNSPYQYGLTYEMFKVLNQKANEAAEKKGWSLSIPPLEYCTDNAAMIAVVGHHSLKDGKVGDLSMVPYARVNK